MGDPIEVQGLTQAFRRYTDRRQFCALGSIKANLGHTDHAAGLAGLLRAVIGQESAFHPCAVSSKGAQGLMQLMPEVASRLGVKDIFDPKQNVEAGAQYLKELLDKYKGDLSRALAAYNAGPAAVDQANGIPDIPETREYVESILGHLSAKPAPDTAR